MMTESLIFGVVAGSGAAYSLTIALGGSVPPATAVTLGAYWETEKCRVKRWRYLVEDEMLTGCRERLDRMWERTILSYG